MRDYLSRAPRFPRVAPLFLAAAVAVAASSLVVSAQSPPTQGTSPFWGPTPPKQSNPFASPPPQQAAPPRPTSPVIARVQGRDITEADFDRIAQPYFLNLKAQLGPSFDSNMQRTAALSVLDELIRRELLALESQRQSVEVSQADIDKILMEDPYFLTQGKFDAAKLEDFKTNPRSNYQLILPRLRETVAIRRLDVSLRQRFKPTAAQVRAEWAKRYEQVRFKMFPLLTREMPLEPEAPEAEWARYYQANSEQFARRTRVRLRYVRLPLPGEGDSTRAAAESQAVARARGIADSLRRRTLPESAAELADTGPFEVPATIIPGLGRVAGLIDTLAKADLDSTIRVVGPYTAPDAVFVGVVADRRPKQVAPMREVLGDVKRLADAEHRRTANEADRRAYYEANRDHWRGTRVALTRVTLPSSAIALKPPAAAEVDRWYEQHGHRLFGKADSSKAWLPPISDSLRAAARGRMADEQRAQRAAETMGKVVAGLRSARDARALAKAGGATAETLTFVKQSNPDSLWRPPFVDSLLRSAPSTKGAVLGPRLFGSYWTAWRIDAVDTSFVPTYEQVRLRSDIEFNQERAKKEEAEARAYFDHHRAEFKTPVKYALDYVAVTIPPPDSVRIPESELRRRYDANRESFRQEEQVKARHILFMARDAGPEVHQRVKARADSLLAAIRKNGGDFADLARRFSEEPGAATSGGDLGWFGRHRMVKEFEDAAFALQPGGVSGVVKTLFGYHIIQVEDRKAAGIRPFDEVRAELRAQMAQARGDSTALRSANALRRRLALGGDAKAIAATHGGVVAATPIAANEIEPSLGFVQGLAQDLPGMSTGKWAAKTYRAGNHYVALRVRQRLPEHAAEFDEARATAIDATRNEKRRAALKLKAAAIRAALAAGASLDSLAAPYGGLKDSGPVVRAASFLPVLGGEPRVIQKAFAAKPGEVTDTLQVSQGLVWLRIEEKKSGDPATLTATSTQIENELVKKRYDAWLEEKKKAVKIEILRPDLKGPRPMAALTPGR